MIGLSSLIFTILEPDRTVIPQGHEGGQGSRSIEVIFRCVRFILLINDYLSFIQHWRVERLSRPLSDDTIRTCKKGPSKPLII